jgi:hypothetical protein
MLDNISNLVLQNPQMRVARFSVCSVLRIGDHYVFHVPDVAKFLGKGDNTIYRYLNISLLKETGFSVDHLGDYATLADSPGWPFFKSLQTRYLKPVPPPPEIDGTIEVPPVSEVVARIAQHKAQKSSRSWIHLDLARVCRQVKKLKKENQARNQRRCRGYLGSWLC